MTKEELFDEVSKNMDSTHYDDLVRLAKTAYNKAIEDVINRHDPYDNDVYSFLEDIERLKIK